MLLEECCQWRFQKPGTCSDQPRPEERILKTSNGKEIHGITIASTDCSLNSSPRIEVEFRESHRERRRRQYTCEGGRGSPPTSAEGVSRETRGHGVTIRLDPIFRPHTMPLLKSFSYAWLIELEHRSLPERHFVEHSLCDPSKVIR
jgi:hypothetical protein